VQKETLSTSERIGVIDFASPAEYRNVSLLVIAVFDWMIDSLTIAFGAVSRDILESMLPQFDGLQSFHVGRGIH
jgi:hypothetical protein